MIEGLQPGSRKPPQEALPDSLLIPGCRLGLHRPQNSLPRAAGERSITSLEVSTVPTSISSAVGERCGFYPAGWLAPTSCLASSSCLHGLLSDSTISQWHPESHQASRDNDVLQKQTHAAGANGNSSSSLHNGALDISHGLRYSGAWHELWQLR